MKRYFYIAIIAGFVTSCTNDSAEELLIQSRETTSQEQSTTLRDTTSIDTGGQGGSTPIKP